MATSRFELCIISPPSGQIYSVKTVSVEIRVLKSGKHVEFSELHPWLGRHPVYVVIDGKHRYKATRVLGKKKGRLVTYLAKISIARFAEGTHELCAEMRLKREGRKPGQVIVSERVEFINDWSAPQIKNVFPPYGAEIAPTAFNRIVIDAIDTLSGLDLSRCIAFLGEMQFAAPTLNSAGITFNMPEAVAAGTYNIRVTLYDRAGNPAESNTRIIVAEPDKSAPVITHIFPADGMNIEPAALRRIIVEATDEGSGLDLSRCTATLDDVKLETPGITATGIVFSAPQSTSAGNHTLRIKLYDKVGNATESLTLFSVIEPIPAVSSEQIEQLRLRNRERLEWDKPLRSKLISDSRAAFAELKVPYTSAISSLLPPDLPKEHADFFAKTDSVRAAEVMSGLTAKIGEALERYSQEEMAALKENLGVEPDAGNNHSKNFSAILQNFSSILSELKISPTTEEQEYLFPEFPQLHADAFAEWMQATSTGTFPERDADKIEARKAFKEKIASDKELKFEWFTQPIVTYRRFFPGASARELLSLPAPVSEEDARRMIDGTTQSTIESADPEPHNSSDFVSAFSFGFIDKLITWFFSTQAPGILPVDIGPTTSTIDVAGTPVDMTLQARMSIPSNSRAANPPDNSISLAGNGEAMVIVDSNTFNFAFTVSPVYDVVIEGEQIILRFNRIDSQITFTGFIGVDEAAELMEQMVSDNYPKTDIYLVDRKPIQFDLPSADCAVRFDRIQIHDDQDSASAGDMYFGLGIDGQETLYGLFEADSGTVVDLALPGMEFNLYRLRKHGQNITVSARGIEYDIEDDCDTLGQVSRIIPSASPGSYAITAMVDYQYFETVFDVVEWIFVPICWLVDVVMEVISWITEKRIERRCRDELHAVIGAIRKLFTQSFPSFTLEFEVIPLSPVIMSIEQTGIFTTTEAVHLAFDISIPGANDRKSKTDAINFIGYRDFGFALSENLIDKLFFHLWNCGAINNRLSTSIDSIGLNAHILVHNPQFNITPFQSVLLKFDLGGKCELLFGDAFPISFPGQVSVENSIGLVNKKLSCNIPGFSFSDAGYTSDILNVLSGFYHDLNYNDAGQISNVNFFEITPQLRPQLFSANYVFDSQLSVGSQEIQLAFSVEILPGIEVAQQQLDFTKSDQRVLTIRSVGQAMLHIASLQIDDPAFSFVGLPALPLNILPGDKVDITVALPSNWTGLHNGTLQLSCNDPKHPQVDVSLLARDVPLIKVEPEQVIFNSYTDVHASVSVNSVGHGVLTITGISVDMDSYRLSGLPALPFTLLPQQHLLFDIETNAVGTFSGTISITSSDAGHPVVRIPVSTDRPLSISSGGYSSGGGGY